MQSAPDKEFLDRGRSDASKKPKKRRSAYKLNKNKYLLPPEMEKLEELLSQFRIKNSKGYFNFRDTLLLELALRTGARARELLNLQIQDINTYDKSLYITGIKGSNDREIPLRDKLFNDLLKWAQTKPNDSDLLFAISYNRLRQIWEMYRPVHKKFHSLRHTFAIHLYKKTKDLRLVQVALGHRNITNTMIYADYVYSQEELRKLIL